MSPCFLHKLHFSECDIALIFCGFLEFMDQESHLPPGDVEEPSVIITSILLKLQDAAAMAISRVRERLAQGLTVFSVVLLLLWIAAFLYGSFYYSYMPTATFSTPVHYYYRLVNLLRSGFKLKTMFFFSIYIYSTSLIFVCRMDCQSPSSFLCSYPMANISLMRNKKNVSTFFLHLCISKFFRLHRSDAAHHIHRC